MQKCRFGFIPFFYKHLLNDADTFNVSLQNTAEYMRRIADFEKTKGCHAVATLPNLTFIDINN